MMQTLKTGQLATRPGTVIEFEHEGGELDVNGVLVRSAAGVSFENNSKYVVALLFYYLSKRREPALIFELDNLGVLRGHKRRKITKARTTVSAPAPRLQRQLKRQPVSVGTRLAITLSSNRSKLWR